MLLLRTPDRSRLISGVRRWTFVSSASSSSTFSYRRGSDQRDRKSCRTPRSRLVSSRTSGTCSLHPVQLHITRLSENTRHATRVGHTSLSNARVWSGESGERSSCRSMWHPRASLTLSSDSARGVLSTPGTGGDGSRGHPGVGFDDLSHSARFRFVTGKGASSPSCSPYAMPAGTAKLSPLLHRCPTQPRVSSP